MRSTITLVTALIVLSCVRPLFAMPSQQDAPAPHPTPALKTRLDAIDKQLEARRYEAALSDAETALKAALAASDHVAEATVVMQRARALVGLLRTDEAIAAWKSAAEVWRQIHEGPGQVEALVSASALVMPIHQKEADELVEQAVAIASAETSRPRQAARELNAAAERANGKQPLGSVQTLAKAALNLLERIDPVSMDTARSLNVLGKIAYAQRSYPAAGDCFKRAMEISEKLSPSSMDVAANLNNMGAVAEHIHDLVAAEKYHKRALEIREKLNPGSLLSAVSLSNLGGVAEDRGDYAAAEDYYKRSLTIREKLAPGSKELAISLNNLGIVAEDRQNLSEAESYYKRGLEIREKLHPGSADVAASLNNLGAVTLERGDLAGAAGYEARAFEIQKTLGPDTQDMAGILDNLGNIAFGHGDLVAAENYHQRALEIDEKLDPRSADTAGSLNNLGNVATYRGDLTAAEKYFKRALEIKHRLAPESTDEALSLGNMGNVALASHDFAAADTYLNHALTIFKKQGLSPNVALCLNGLGNVSYTLGELKDAENYYKQALELLEKLAPGSLFVSFSLSNLGNIAYSQGDIPAAESYHERALKIRENLAPGSLEVAESLVNLGTVHEKLHHPEEALPLYSRAGEILEDQRGDTAGADARKLLVEAHTNVYAALLGAYIAVHQDSGAFETLELTRGRSLAENLFEHRNINFNKDVSPALLLQQTKIDNARNIALKDRQKLDPSDKSGLNANDALLQDIKARQRQLEKEIRLASPRYANLQYPKPLGIKNVQSTLDPGTLLVEYAIAEQKTYIFTVTKNTLHCYTINISRSDLLTKIQTLAYSLENDNAPQNPAVAVELYNLLLKPAQAEIRSALRLLVCPDQELWKVPFCALIDNNDTASPHYLVESKPIHSIVSMNVYAQLLTTRIVARVGAHSLLAFGNPAYGVTQPTSDTHLGGRTFQRMPVTGAQVRAIGALFGKGAIVHEGASATRTAAIKEAVSYRVLHFACHGTLDDGDPLSSFLALSPEQTGDQYGRLAGYDVIQNLRMNADLVTLAACQTGAGGQSRTEGVIGLTRAFEYAGARSILVSLWEIDANSSTQLMSGINPLEPDKPAGKSAVANSFYGAWLSGMSKDMALQAAQIALIHGTREEYRDPRHWAAFSLQGDWK